MSKKKFIFHPNEKVIGVVSREVFAKMHQIARDLDLDKNGIYDSRGGGAINLWVSPSDKPSDYTFEITKGRLNYPRNFLASIYPEFIDDGRRVKLYMVIHNSARENLAKHLYSNGEISYEEYKEKLELAEKGTDSEWSWALEKAKWLIETAEKEAVFKEIIYCPYCGREFPELKLFNEFILHLATHIQIKSVILTEDGIHIETEKHTLTPQDYIKTKRTEDLNRVS
jgi:hypothetical protein